MPARSSRRRRFSDQTTKSQIAAVNPASTVPVLHDGDFVIWDSLAICEWAAEVYPTRTCGPTTARHVHVRARSAPRCTRASSHFVARCRWTSLAQARPGHTPRRSPMLARPGDLARSTRRERRAVPVRHVHDRRRDVRAGDDAVHDLRRRARRAVPPVRRGLAGSPRTGRGSPTPSPSRSRATNMSGGRIVQLARSDGGVPKLAIPEAHAGSSDSRATARTTRSLRRSRACAVPVLARGDRALQAEGHPISPGSTGENVTIAGLDWASLRAGTRSRSATKSSSS